MSDTNTPETPTAENQNQENTAADTEKKSEETPIDYKTENERLLKQISQAEYKLKQKNIQNKQKQISPDEDEEAEEVPTVDIEEMIKREVGKIGADLQRNTVEDIISSYTDNPDERALIRTVYQNQILKSGFDRASIEQDLGAAYAIANKPKLAKVMAEAIRAKDNRAPQGMGGGGHRIEGDVPTEDPQLSDADKKFMNAWGITNKDLKK